MLETMETLSGTTRRHFVVRSPKHSRLRVIGLAVVSGRRDVFGWDADRNGFDGGFTIWVKAMPEDAGFVYSALLRVTVTDCQSTMERHVSFDARVLVTASSKENGKRM
jgi:hypothetical protein